MRGKIIIICILIALLVSSGSLSGKAFADAILFPWIVKSNTASTLISVVNTAAGNAINNISPTLHYEYLYKSSSTNGDTEVCVEYDFNHPTSINDLVSFDASGIMDGGKALFNDDPYNNQSFSLMASAPRRGFLIVDNNTVLYSYLGQNVDGTLYGEALTGC
jgi:hypothetical protein